MATTKATSPVNTPAVPPAAPIAPALEKELSRKFTLLEDGMRSVAAQLRCALDVLKPVEERVSNHHSLEDGQKLEDVGELLRSCMQQADHLAFLADGSVGEAKYVVRNSTSH